MSLDWTSNRLQRGGDHLSGQKCIDDLVVVAVVVETGNPCWVDGDREREWNRKDEERDAQQGDNGQQLPVALPRRSHAIPSITFIALGVGDGRYDESKMRADPEGAGFLGSCYGDLRNCKCDRHTVAVSQADGAALGNETDAA